MSIVNKSITVVIMGAEIQQSYLQGQWLVLAHIPSAPKAKNLYPIVMR